jgi:hypothetical protein
MKVEVVVVGLKRLSVSDIERCCESASDDDSSGGQASPKKSWRQFHETNCYFQLIFVPSYFPINFAHLGIGLSCLEIDRFNVSNFCVQFDALSNQKKHSILKRKSEVEVLLIK